MRHGRKFEAARTSVTGANYIRSGVGCPKGIGRADNKREFATFRAAAANHKVIYRKRYLERASK